MTSFEWAMLGAAALVIMCVFASKAAEKMGVPTLVFFLAIGVVAGREGLGKIDFDNAEAAQSFGILALSYILFSGGLDTKLQSIRPVMKSALSLVTLGVIFTCLLVGSFVHFILGFSFMESYLIGAIVSSTDAGAVFTVLRSRNIHLKGNLRPLLELESGTNDPMAVFLTTSMLQLMLTPEFKVIDIIPLLVVQMTVGAVLGFLAGRGMAFMFNKVKLKIEGLYTVLSIASVVFIFSGTQALKGNGFLAVYIAGLILGDQAFVFKKSLTLVHDGISWLMQSAMFLTLGLLIYPSQVFKVAGPAMFISIFMLIAGRPISVFLCLAFSKLSIREKSLVSWVGLRGSVPIILATYPLVAGIDRAGLIFNLIFFVALSSLIIQGTSIPFVSKLFKVNDPQALPNREYSSTPGHLGDIVMVDVPENSPVAHKSIVEMAIPHQKVLIIAVERNGEVIIPRGSTTFEPHDKISLIADDESLGDFVEMLWIPMTEKENRRMWRDLTHRPPIEWH
jgi:cell volume regulation protein A